MLKIHHSKIPKTITKSQFQTITSTSRPQNRTHKPSSKRRKPKPIPFLDDLKQLHNPDEALSLFEDYTQKGAKHDYPSYASLLYKLARSRKFDQIDPLLDFIKNRGIRCREGLFIALMQHYGKCQLVEKAIELFNQMPNFNCERNLQSFNILLNVLIDNDRFSDANDLFLRWKELGFKPN
uniref:Pentatricopeptide repeat-containing protein n=1 Tax=Chenopodium quinoa TaxID=63459 RepID=A0A803LCP6_CHEQI